MPVLSVLVVGTFLALTSEVLPIGLLTPIAADLHTSTTAVGVLVSVYAFIVAVASVPLTLWLRHRPRRPVLVVLLFGYAVTTILFGLAGAYPVAFAMRIIGGFVHAAFFSAVFGAGADAMPPGRGGRGAAIVSIGTTTGFAVGVPAGTALGVAMGWRAAFVATGVALGIVAVVAALVVPAGLRATVAALEAGRGTLRRLRPIAIVIAVLMLGHYAAYTYISPLLALDGVPLPQQSAVLLVYGVAGAVGVAVAALAADRRPRAASAVAIGLTAACLVVLAVQPGLALVLVATGVWGACFAALIPLLQTIASAASPAAGDLAPAVVNATFNTGIAGGGLLGGGLLLVAPPALLAAVAAVLVAAGLAGLVGIRRLRTG